MQFLTPFLVASLIIAIAPLRGSYRSQDLDTLKSRIAFYENFPKPGILFQDFSPLLRDGETLRLCIDLLAERYQEKQLDVVVGLESRGFILGAALAYRLGIGFVPVRKAGKIPGDTLTVSYEKEYGTDSFSLSAAALTPGQRVLIVDDLIATGGSAKAAEDLIRQSGAEPVEFASILEIKELGGRHQLGIPAFNLLD